MSLNPHGAALGAYLESCLTRTWGWGDWDCILNPADWLIATGRRDPAGAWRGKYHSARGARRILRHAGGVVALMGAAAADLGLAETADPIAGDVAALRVRAAHGVDFAGAVRSPSGRWAIAHARGLRFAPRDTAVAASWRVPPL